MRAASLVLVTTLAGLHCTLIPQISASARNDDPDHMHARSVMLLDCTGWVDLINFVGCQNDNSIDGDFDDPSKMCLTRHGKNRGVAKTFFLHVTRTMTYESTLDTHTYSYHGTLCTVK